MRRDTTLLFDVEADEAEDLTQQFWGSSRGWVSAEQPLVDAPARDLTGSIRVIRDGLTAFRPRQADTTDRINRVGRTRQHGAVRPAARRELTLAELATRELPLTDDVVAWDDAEPTRPQETFSPVVPLAERLGVGAVDPLLLRLGVVLLIGALLVPLAFALRPSDADGAIRTEPGAAAPAADVAALVEVEGEAGTASPATPALPAAGRAVGSAADTSDTSDTSDAARDDTVGVAPAAAPSPRPAPAADATATPSSADATAAGVGDVPQDEPVAVAAGAATVSATAERLMPECPQTYVAGAGDSWYRIASAAGITPDALMSENRATVDTPIFPGDDICLPAGAAVPAPPTTVPATTTPSTTAAPTTTMPPTTAPPATTAEVQAMIREIWPDELEAKALDVAWRESRYVATAYNGWCCYGVFQIYWTVHDGWLDDYGIYSSSDLFDARKNITAAYALYQRAGGWGPWGG
jgi:hypothetical protein